MNRLEQQGVVSAYTPGHTGMAATRHERDGKLDNPDMGIFPMTPLTAIVKGAASVTDEGAHWRVKAGDGAALEFTAMRLRQ